MVIVTFQNYTDAKVCTITVGNRELFWVKRIDKKRISDLVRKNIQGIFETKNPTKKQIRKYKRSQKDISKKSTDDSKIKYDRNDLMEKIGEFEKEKIGEE